MSEAAKAELIAPLNTFESFRGQGNLPTRKAMSMLHDPSTLEHNEFYNCLADHGFDDLVSNQVGLTVYPALIGELHLSVMRGTLIHAKAFSCRLRTVAPGRPVVQNRSP